MLGPQLAGPLTRKIYWPTPEGEFRGNNRIVHEKGFRMFDRETPPTWTFIKVTSRVTRAQWTSSRLSIVTTEFYLDRIFIRSHVITSRAWYSVGKIYIVLRQRILNFLENFNLKSNFEDIKNWKVKFCNGSRAELLMKNQQNFLGITGFLVWTFLKPNDDQSQDFKEMTISSIIIKIRVPMISRDIIGKTRRWYMGGNSS